MSQSKKRVNPATAVVGMAVAAGLASEASAADRANAPADHTSANSIEGVVKARLLADGSAELTFTDGRVERISASDVMVDGGEIFVSHEAAADAVAAGEAAAAGSGIGHSALLIAGGVIAGGVGIAAAAGAFGGDDEPENTAPVFTSGVAASVAENSVATGYTATAADADGDAVTFAIAGGADASRFVINATTGQLSFVAAPNFEAPSDANGDNRFDVTISASDGEATVLQTVTITVTNVNDVAPQITSAAAFTAAENRTTAFTATAVDPEGDAITFSISGADAARFAINAQTGVVTFIAAPDFETPADAGANNVFDIIVTASDGVNSTTQAVSITVANAANIAGDADANAIVGSAAVEEIDGGAGDDVILSLGGSDTLTGGAGDDRFAYEGDRFEGVDVSAAGRQVVGNEDFITDFDFANDRYTLNGADFGVTGPVNFVSLDANAAGATIPAGANVIVLRNSDDDANPATAFNAGSAANQIANLVTTDGAGFFIYFNSALNVNRLVFSSNLNDPTADLRIIARQSDLTGQAAIDALASFTASNFEIVADIVPGTANAESLTGGAGVDVIAADAGDDTIVGGGAGDLITTGAGADRIVTRGPAFDGADVSAAGRQVIGNEDFIADFSFASDRFVLNALDFNVTGALSFQALDANAVGAAINPGANVIVLLNSDNDANAATAFNAGTAATQIANLVTQDGAGFFVYFNSSLNVNRLVYSTNLNDAAADLKIVGRLTDLTGQAAIDALASFTAANFEFEGSTITGTAGSDALQGAGGVDTISGDAGDDLILGRGAGDAVATGSGRDFIVFSGPAFDGANVSAAGRRVIGNEDFVSDFNFASDRYVLSAADFGVNDPVVFAALDANAAGATIAAGANVIVLLNSDNDANAATAFNAGTAATQIANLVTQDGAGFFIYFNSSLNVNRLVYSTNLNDAAADLKILSRQTDLTGQAAIDALDDFTAANFQIADAIVIADAAGGSLAGGAGSDLLFGGAGADQIDGAGASDTLQTGAGADRILFQGDPFDGADVSAAGRQVIGNEDFVQDFDFLNDAYTLDSADFGVTGGVSFQAVDANAVGAAINPGANVIVLLNSDNDANPATAFNAGTAATQIANLVTQDGAGFFVYFNSSLNVNRLVYSTNLNDATADLKILSRHTDLTGQAAIDALDDFTAANFLFQDLSAATSKTSNAVAFTDLSSEDATVTTSSAVSPTTIDAASIDVLFEQPIIVPVFDFANAA